MEWATSPSSSGKSGIRLEPSRKKAILALPFLLFAAVSGRSQSEPPLLARALSDLAPAVLPEELRARTRNMISAKLRSEIAAANRRSTAQWRRIRTRAQWERFRQRKLDLLRGAIGPFPESVPPKDLRVTGTMEGDGYRVQNIVFRTRPGVWTAANLYLPARPRDSMPGIMICHSHHTPKEHGELQDMGMTWARRGCMVLVPELPGHGERRQHPFASKEDYPKPYRVSRQDYYFRFDLGIQLHLAGESLMGWFVWDLWRSLDVLLSQDGIDPDRIILLGAVAGGGDVAAVAAALDPRIKAAVPFNFGGAQPETVYPLPEDAESTFNYAGWGSFESTRNLRRSAADGFLPWVTVGSIAPRRLVYAHEFAWDKPRDPVWKRFERIWGGFYNARDHLAALHGRGSVKGRPPASTHCTHIGRVHQESLHPILKRWFGISVTPQEEYSRRLEPAKLRCMTSEWRNAVKPRPFHEILSAIARRRSAEARKRHSALAPSEFRTQLRREWSAVLGEVAPSKPPILSSRETVESPGKGLRVEKIVLDVESGIMVPLLLLFPARPRPGPYPVVCAVARGGKKGFLRKRAEPIAELLRGGAAVCLPDLRGTGETQPSGSLEIWGKLTDYASTRLMLGRTTVGDRLRDLRSVLFYLHSRKDIDRSRIALWGDSFAEVNPPDRDFRMPHHLDGRPLRSRPLGGLLALLAALYEEDVRAVYVRGGLLDFQCVLSHPFVYIPFDIVIPGVVRTGDLPLLAASLAPRPLRLEALVDAYNRTCPADRVKRTYRPCAESYKKAGAKEKFTAGEGATSPGRWLLRQLAANWKPERDRRSGAPHAARRPYRLSTLSPRDLRENRVIWGAMCMAPEGHGLAFGGQDQDSPDGRPHTRIFADGKRTRIDVELRARNPLQEFHREARKLRNEIKSLRARARFLYFQGVVPGEEAETIRISPAPRCREIRSGVAALRERLAAFSGPSYERRQAVYAKRYVESALRLLPEFAALKSVTARTIKSLFQAQVRLELAAEALDAEPPPRALDCGVPRKEGGKSGRGLVYDPKTDSYVLFGGDHLDYLTNDTWVFDRRKLRWFQRHPAGAPPPRANHRLEAHGDGTVTMTDGYTYSSNTDYVGGQYIDIDDGVWTYDITTDTWRGGVMRPADTRTYRTGPFHPFFFLAGEKPEADSFRARLEKLPSNRWVETSPPRLPRLNRDWGTVILDPDHDLLLRWCGGHSAHGGTDVLHYHLRTNRWELCYPVEFPLGQLYSNTAYPAGFNFNLRPWITGHSYQSYGYDRTAKVMLFAGRTRHCYIYDPLEGDWTGRFPKPAGMVREGCYYTLTLCPTPKGVVAWTREGELFRYEARHREWLPMELKGARLPGSVVDNSTVVFDSKRNRLLLVRKGYGREHRYDGRIYAVDLDSHEVSILVPRGAEAAAAVPYLCQLRYDPENDLVLVGGTLPPGEEGFRRTPAYDCAGDRWISLKIGGRDPSGPRGRDPSLGMVYDPKRKLFWAVDARSRVYVLRLDPETADLRDLR